MQTPSQLSANPYSRLIFENSIKQQNCKCHILVFVDHNIEEKSMGAGAADLCELAGSQTCILQQMMQNHFQIPHEGHEFTAIELSCMPSCAKSAKPSFTVSTNEEVPD